MTKDDVRAEHVAAMASLDGAQGRALRRISQAFLRSRFGNCSAKDMLEEVFEQEAADRSSGAGPLTASPARRRMP